MDFTFMAPRKIIVRRGGFSDIGNICSKYMRRACLFRYGDSFIESGMYDTLNRSMKCAGVELFDFGHVGSQPNPALINDAAAFMRGHKCDGALAVGGGSPIDAAKAACALAVNGSDIMEHMEGFANKPFENAPYPLVAVPTTAGTGSECTKNAVITQAGQFKKSVRADDMLPVAALIDAALMTSVPQQTTAEAGADCLCQLMEAYVSKGAEPFSDAIALHFIKPVFEWLPIAYNCGGNLDARENMALSACASGMAMANAGLGAAHGLASGLGALTTLSHGLICGVLLPHVIRLNADKGVLKYADVTNTLTDKSYPTKEAAAYALSDMVADLNRRIGIPENFKQFAIPNTKVKEIVNASMGSSMSKNPVELTKVELTAFLEKLI